LTKFFGEGHTKDNVVAYFLSEKILFGGCLLKELEASKGYLVMPMFQHGLILLKKLRKNIRM
jgi:hypothetical protein